MRILSAFLAVAFVFAAEPTGYMGQIRAWQEHREASLRSPEGWLTLVGLFWLQPGRDYTIGSGSNCEFQLPAGSAPPVIGKLRLESGHVTFTNMAGAGVTVDGKSVGQTVLQPDISGNPSVVKGGEDSFFVIQRGDRYGIRARDPKTPTLLNFKGTRFFPISNQWHVQATFVPDAKKIPILNVLGQTDLEDSPGYVEFTADGQHLRLRPVFEGDTLFFLFKDATSKTETYHAGRMLNTPQPKDGKVDLDFNRAYTPPCAFTPYATCPLPPKENILPVAVTAGEKRP